MEKPFYRLFVLLILFFFPAAAPAQTEQGDQMRSLYEIVVGEQTRQYRLYVPEHYDSRRAWPLVFAFHGAGNTGRTFAKAAGLDGLAEKEGFIAVFPDGHNQIWNMLGPLEWGEADRDRADDLAFVRALLDMLRASYTIDNKRIYAAGMSMGGMFAYTLACRMAEDFAAVAVVGGTLNTPDCQPADTVAVLHVHGRQDDIVPLHGGVGRLRYRNDWPSAIKGLEFWTGHNRCSGEPVEALINSKTRCRRYQFCVRETELCLFEGGHEWPGARVARQMSEYGTGRGRGRTFPTSSYIWEFFEDNGRN